MARVSAHQSNAAGAHDAPGRMERTLLAVVRTSLVLALAAPFIVMGAWLPEALYPYIVGKALYFRLVVEIAFAAWLLLIIRCSAYRPARSWLLLCLVVYLLVALLASFAGVSLTRSLWSNYERMQGWFSLAHYTLFALMLASVFRDFRQWRIVLNVNLLAGLAVGLIGLYEMVTAGGQRLIVTFGNPSFLASYALVNAFIAAAFLARSLAAGRPSDPTVAASTEVSRALIRSFWVAVICLDLLLLNYSGTRGAIVGLAAGVAVILVAGALWANPRALRIACVSVLIGLLALGAGFVALRDAPAVAGLLRASPTLQRFADITPAASTVRSRISSTSVGLKAFSDRPLLGWGPENYGVAYDSHVDGAAAASMLRFDQAHNRIIEELVTAGIVGLAAYAAVWASLLFLLVAGFRRAASRARPFIAFIGAGLAAYFVQNLFLFDTPAASVQLYLLFGFALFVASFRAGSALDDDNASPPVPARSRGIAGRIEGAVSRHVAVPAAVAAVIAVATLGTGYLLVAGPYTGSTNTRAALSGARTGEQRFAIYQRAVSAAPGLANGTTRRFVGFVTQHWESLTDEQRTTALELATRDVAAGLAREPMEWRLHLALARLYHRASEDHPALVEASRPHVDAAAAIAPGRLEALQLKALQLLHEEDEPAAFDLVDGYLRRAEPYLERDSTAYRQLEELRNSLAGHR